MAADEGSPQNMERFFGEDWQEKQAFSEDAMKKMRNAITHQNVLQQAERSAGMRAGFSRQLRLELEGISGEVVPKKQAQFNARCATTSNQVAVSTNSNEYTKGEQVKPEKRIPIEENIFTKSKIACKAEMDDSMKTNFEFNNNIDYTNQDSQNVNNTIHQNNQKKIKKDQHFENEKKKQVKDTREDTPMRQTRNSLLSMEENSRSERNQGNGNISVKKDNSDKLNKDEILAKAVEVQREKEPNALILEHSFDLRFAWECLHFSNPYNIYVKDYINHLKNKYMKKMGSNFFKKIAGLLGDEWKNTVTDEEKNVQKRMVEIIRYLNQNYLKVTKRNKDQRSKADELETSTVILRYTLVLYRKDSSDILANFVCRAMENLTESSEEIMLILKDITKENNVELMEKAHQTMNKLTAIENNNSDIDNTL